MSRLQLFEYALSASEDLLHHAVTHLETEMIHHEALHKDQDSEPSAHRTRIAEERMDKTVGSIRSIIKELEHKTGLDGEALEARLQELVSETRQRAMEKVQAMSHDEVSQITQTTPPQGFHYKPRDASPDLP